MGCAKSIDYKDIAKSGIFLRSLVSILFLALVEAAIFQDDQFAFFNLETAIYPVLDQADRLPQAHRDIVSNRLERVLFRPNAFLGAAEMRGHHYPGSLF